MVLNSSWHFQNLQFFRLHLKVLHVFYHTGFSYRSYKSSCVVHLPMPFLLQGHHRGVGSLIAWICWLTAMITGKDYYWMWRVGIPVFISPHPSISHVISMADEEHQKATFIVDAGYEVSHLNVKETQLAYITVHWVFSLFFIKSFFRSHSAFYFFLQSTIIYCNTKF